MDPLQLQPDATLQVKITRKEILSMCIGTWSVVVNFGLETGFFNDIEFQKLVKTFGNSFFNGESVEWSGLVFKTEEAARRWWNVNAESFLPTHLLLSNPEGKILARNFDEKKG